MMTVDQFARLPRYAREEIERLRANVEYERSRWESTLPRKSGFVHVSLQDVTDPNKCHPLPSNSRVRFHVLGDRDMERHIDVFLDDQGIQVHGEEPLLVRMQSSNVFNVESTGF